MLSSWTKTFALIVSIVAVSACSRPVAYAPVVNGWQQPLRVQGLYKARSGDSVYSIAWAYGLDYRRLAAYNQIRPPYVIQRGQRLQLNIPKHWQVAQTASQSTPAKPRGQLRHRGPEARQSMRSSRISPPIQVAVPSRFSGQWQWPVNGPVLAKVRAHQHGIDIGGTLGQPVRAAAAGKVVYSGHGLKGYGNLIIIKHSAHYLSAYAFNQHIRVREGAAVIAGQPIATMGHGHGGRVMLHFEIRANGRPVSPVRFLPTSKSHK